MCVIIFVPKGETISSEEIKQAWRTNPDGAGYSIQKENGVYFKRGFMDLNTFEKEITPLIGNYNLMLHFRISTSKSVNRMQTHPYKKGNVSVTEGFTKRPVICMNGIISGQTEYLNCNDTMSYIIDHQDAFSIVNQDILNIIEEATGAKWAVMKPNEVLLSSKFTKENGRFYSNTNHLWTTYYLKRSGYRKKTVKNLIKNQGLLRNIKRDKELYADLQDFVEFWCNNSGCYLCTKCLNTAKTIRDVKITLHENMFYVDDYLENDNDYYLDNDESENNNYCESPLDYFYEDFYDYDKEYLDYSKLENIFDE